MPIPFHVTFSTQDWTQKKKTKKTFLPRVSKRRVSHHSRKFPIFFCMPSAYYTLSFPSYLLRKNIFHFPNDGPSSFFSPSPCLGHRKLPAHKSLSSSFFFWGAFLGCCCCHCNQTKKKTQTSPSSHEYYHLGPIPLFPY